MYIQINKNNIYNYLTNDDIITINQHITKTKQKIFNFIYDIKTIIKKGADNYLNIINNLLLLNYIDNYGKILFVINIKNLNDIKFYKKKYFYDFGKNIKVINNNITTFKIINYGHKIKTSYIKYNRYSISITNNIINYYKSYINYKLVYKEIIIDNINKIKYYIYYIKYIYKYYILREMYKKGLHYFQGECYRNYLYLFH